jgi:hypothetical protein
MMKRIAVFTLLAAAAGLAQTVNCLVAVVNNEVITLLDVQITAEFGLGNASDAGVGTDAKLAALDALIDRKVVLDLAREARGLTGEELDAAVAGLRSALGEEAFAAKLAKFGLREKDLEPYLEERILYDRALALRFRSRAASASRSSRSSGSQKRSNPRSGTSGGPSRRPIGSGT